MSSLPYLSGNMVHYIRFLKPPRFTQVTKDPRRPVLSTLITITTDLGDAFYPGDVCIYVAMADHATVKPLGTACWRSGMRCLQVDKEVPRKEMIFPIRILFTCNESLKVDSLQLGQLPDIVSAWTDDFGGPDGLNADLIIRQFLVPNGQVLNICEENGESIAHHIW